MKKEIHLKRSLYVLLIISLFAITLISALSYNNINNAKELQQDTYINAFMPVSQSAEFKANMLEVKLNIEMLLRKGLDQSYIDKINKLTSENLEILKLYSERQLDDQELIFVSTLNETNKVNNERVQIILVEITNGGQINTTMIENYILTSDNLDHAIDDAIDYAITDAESLNTDSVIIAQKNINNFFSILAVVLLVLILLVFFIIRKINASIGSIISSFDVVSKGDFTIQISKDDKTEFGKMKNALSETVSSIKHMVKLVGETSTSVDTQATEVLLMSDKIKESTSKVTTIIEDVAIGSSSQKEAVEAIHLYFGAFSEKISHIVKKIKDVNIHTDIINTEAIQGNEEIKLLILSSNHLSRSFNEVSLRNEELSNNIKAIRDITGLL
ncbi:MAG: methyl-accepting chemotaxis protein, partial [Acidaminobacteraceae bacterium]